MDQKNAKVVSTFTMATVDHWLFYCFTEEEDHFVHVDDIIEPRVTCTHF